MMKYRFSELGFEQKWTSLINEFTVYCENLKISIPECGIEEFIFEAIDNNDDLILSRDFVDSGKGDIAEIDYAWYKFIEKSSQENVEIFNFIAAICTSNILKQALFYTGEQQPIYEGLNVYLDSPMIFALLGMDTEERTESYKILVSDMIKCGCKVQVLDHDFQEVDGIISRAAKWALSAEYDIRKANNAARFFHDNGMTMQEISEFCAGIEDELNFIGITIRETSYDTYQNDFQEDENKLFDMIKDRYNNKGLLLTPEREESIQVDIRSIVIVYRQREGNIATRLENASHILLTTNNVIANASRDYESNQSINSGHIPACISADLFGTLLWLSSPVEMMNYHKKKLLADCFDYLQPDKALIDRYTESLNEAYKSDEIDEKKYLFLRAHPIVLTSLMDVTHGDYARYDSNTYREVYDDIVAKSMKQYEDEVAAHQITREELKEKENTITEKDNKLTEQDNEINELKKHIDNLEKDKKNQENAALEKKINRLGWMITGVFVALPYLLVTVI